MEIEIEVVRKQNKSFENLGIATSTKNARSENSAKNKQ